LFITRYARDRDTNIVGLGVSVGVAQSLALIPGISRSGATISVAMLYGAEREFAAKLSFVAAIPAILGAAALEFLSQPLGDISWGCVLSGFFGAFLSGLAALSILIKLIRAGHFYIFSYYLWAIGILSIILSAVSG